MLDKILATFENFDLQQSNQNVCGRQSVSCTAALRAVYRSTVEYIGESGKGSKRNMRRARREKIYEESMRIYSGVHTLCGGKV